MTIAVAMLCFVVFFLIIDRLGMKERLVRMRMDLDFLLREQSDRSQPYQPPSKPEAPKSVESFQRRQWRSSNDQN